MDQRVIEQKIETLRYCVERVAPFGGAGVAGSNSLRLNNRNTVP